MEKFKKYWKNNSWKWGNLGALAAVYIGAFSIVLAITAVIASVMAWLTMHAWSIVVVGIFGFSREITFWEAFVVYLILAFIFNNIRSETKVTTKR